MKLERKGTRMAAKKKHGERRSPKPKAGKVDASAAKRELYSAAATVKKKDVQKLVERKREFEEKLGDVPGKFKKMINQLGLLFELIRDYWSGKYKQVPWLSVTFAAAAVIYFLSPIDLIPDFIPVVGYVDDALVVGFAIMALEEDLQTYCRWKKYKVDRYF